MLLGPELLRFCSKMTYIGQKLGYVSIIFNPKNQEFEIVKSRIFIYCWAVNMLVSFMTSLLLGSLVYTVNLQHRNHQVSTGYLIYFIALYIGSNVGTGLGIFYYRNEEELLFIGNSAFQINALIERKRQVAVLLHRCTLDENWKVGRYKSCVQLYRTC